MPAGLKIGASRLLIRRTVSDPAIAALPVGGQQHKHHHQQHRVRACASRCRCLLFYSSRYRAREKTEKRKLRATGNTKREFDYAPGGPSDGVVPLFRGFCVLRQCVVGVVLAKITVRLSAAVILDNSFNAVCISVPLITIPNRSMTFSVVVLGSFVDFPPRPSLPGK